MLTRIMTGSRWRAAAIGFGILTGKPRIACCRPVAQLFKNPVIVPEPVLVFPMQDNFGCLWWWANGGVPTTAIPASRVLGYALTLWGSPALIVTNQNKTIQPQSMAFGPLTVQQAPPTDRVLIADATISLLAQHTEALKYSGGYNYIDIQGGYAKHHLSAHLKGNVPSGGNLGFVDGHVEWRKFEVMTVRGYGGVGGAQDNGTCPTFWW